MSKNLSSTETRALELLGSGCAPETVASALGVTASRISQLLSDETFALAVADLRFKNLQRHSAIDSSYDSMEETLLEKLKDLLPLMMRPMEVLKALQVLNGAKRRGAASVPGTGNAFSGAQIVQINMPTVIHQQILSDVNNQVVQIGSQNLVTIQPNVLLKKVQASERDKPRAIEADSREEARTHAA